MNYCYLAVAIDACLNVLRDNQLSNLLLDLLKLHVETVRHLLEVNDLIWRNVL